jgi:RND family efflux transporter MFP subunit
MKILLPFAVLAVAAIGAATMILLKPEVETRRPDIKPPLVRVATVALGDVELVVKSQGTVSPRTESQLVPEVSGRVIWVSPSLVSGGFFETAETLLKIDPHDYRQFIVTAEAEVARAKLRLEQEEAEAVLAAKEWKDLGEGDADPLTLREPQLLDARAALAAAEANLEKRKRDLDRTQIRAPYAGRVRQEHVDLGQFVTVGGPLATIYAVDSAEIRLPLPDYELAYLELPLVYRGDHRGQQGPPVLLRANFAGKDYEWEGWIVRTEGEIDRTSRMVHAVAEVQNPYGRSDQPDRPPLAVGMYVEAEIQGVVAENVAVLPRAALRDDDRVLVVDAANRLRFRDVDVLRETRENIIVRSGLDSGEKVNISPLGAVTDGMQVRIAREGAPEKPLASEKAP